MTTIAWRFPFMACDSRCTTGSQITNDHFEKITRTACGGLLGIAGDADTRAVTALLDTVKTGRAVPDAKTLLDLNTDFAAILALPDGTVWLIDATHPEDTDLRASASAIPVHDTIAIGSGGKFAKAAMDMGASAERAVRVGIKNDSASGGRVQVHELVLKRRRKRSE